MLVPDGRPRRLYGPTRKKRRDKNLNVNSSINHEAAASAAFYCRWYGQICSILTSHKVPAFLKVSLLVDVLTFAVLHSNYITRTSIVFPRASL